MRRKQLSAGERAIYGAGRTSAKSINIDNVAGKLDWIEGIQYSRCDRYGLMVLEASINGWTRLLMWILRKNREHVKLALDASIAYGHEKQSLRIWRWNKNQFSFDDDCKTMCAFAEAGFLRNILICLKNYPGLGNSFHSIVVSASKGGRVKMMKLLMKIRDRKFVNYSSSVWDYALCAAVRLGQIRSIKFARKMGAISLQFALSDAIKWRQHRAQKLIEKWMRE